MKQTAVEWLFIQFQRTGIYPKYSIDNEESNLKQDLIHTLIEQAKEMEKQQIIEAYNEGQNTPYEYSESNDVNWYDGNNYYKETFES